MSKQLLQKTFELIAVGEKLGAAKLLAIKNDLAAKFYELGLKRNAADGDAGVQHGLDYIAFKIRFYRLANNLLRSPALDTEIAQRWAVLQQREDLTLDVLLNDEAQAAPPQPQQPVYDDTVLKDAGQYSIHEGKLMKGPAERREFAVYSNWQGANADPDDIEHHKQLLDRQHFGGPFWEGKAKPVSIEKQTPAYMPADEDTIPQGYAPGDTEPGQQGFTQIKSN